MASSLRMRRFFSSLQAGLIGLVLLAMLPALGLVLFMGLRQRHTAVEHGVSQVRALTQTVAAAVRSETAAWPSPPDPAAWTGIDLGGVVENRLPQPTPPGMLVLVVNGRGVALACWPAREGVIGRIALDLREVRAAVVSDRPVSRLGAPDGPVRLWDIDLISRSADAYLALGIPRATALAEADGAVRDSLILLVAAALLSLLLSWTWGRYAILEPMDTIVAASRRVSGGDFSTRSGIEALGGQVGQLARAFDDMAASIESRDREAAEATAAMRDTNQTLQAVLTAAPLAVMAVDLAGRVILWTPAAERVYGWRADEVMGRRQPWLDSEDQRNQSDELMRRAASGERLVGLELRRRRRDGRTVDLRIFTAPLRRPDGTIYGTVGVLEDITDRRRLEGQLQQAQKMEAVGRLAGGMAHDFNNLLTVIRGFAELALQRRGLQVEVQSSLIEIRKAVTRASSLIRQLLTFSRQPLGDPRVLDMNAVISDMSNMLGPLIGETVTLVVERSEGPACVRADSGQLAQVVTNLVVNARDAMPRGGEIRISASTTEVRAGGPHAIAGLDPGAYVVLSVADNGRGMGPETLEHIFEPFFSTKELWEGTGLGLSTVYALVTQAGGNVFAESVPGSGSAFRVYLPRVNAVPDVVEDGIAIPPALATGSGTVLVVEDEKAVRDVVRETLQCAGYTVLDACHGDEALRLCLAHQGHIDLVLTDVVMPGIAGPELVRQIERQRPGIKVLYMSGHAPRTFDPQGALRDGTPFLAKPFTLEALAARVAEILEGGGREGERRPAA